MSSETGKKVDLDRILARLDEVRELEPLDWVLALLRAAGGRLRSRFHVQKALYIASKHSRAVADTVEFRAYRMGPWSEEVSDALVLASSSGLVREEGGSLALTEKGRAHVDTIWGEISARDREILEEVASFLNEMDEDELLLYTYVVYGGGERSDVLERLLKRRKEIAARLLGKGLVSTGLAAELAGAPLTEFLKYLKKKGVKPFTAEPGDVDEVSLL